MKIPKYIDKEMDNFIYYIACSEASFSIVEAFILKNGLNLWELEDDLYSPNSILRFNEPHAYMSTMRQFIKELNNEKL